MTRRGLVSFTQPSEAAEIPFTQPTEQKYEVPSVLVDLSSDLEFCLPAAGSKATGCSLVEGLEQESQEKIFTYFVVVRGYLSATFMPRLCVYGRLLAPPRRRAATGIGR